MARLIIPDETTFAKFAVSNPRTVFPITYALFAKADLRISVDGIDLTQSDFTFAGTLLEGGGYQGGTVTLTTAVADCAVLIWREIVPARAGQFAPSNSVPVRTIDQALNRQMALIQDLQRDNALAVRVDYGNEPVTPADLSDVINGLRIGSTVQAYDADLDAIAGLTSTADSLPYFTGPGEADMTPLPSWARSLIASSSARAARLALGEGTVINVDDYPGTDPQKVAAAAAAIRLLSAEATSFELPVRVVFAARKWIMTSSGDLTNLGWRFLDFDMRGAVFIGTCSGRAILDTLGCRFYTMRGGVFLGDQTNKPLCAILYGRTATGGSGDCQLFDNVSTYGWFTKCAMFNQGAESDLHIHPRYWIANSDPDVSCLVMDGAGYFGAVSDFVTPLPANTPDSFVHHTFVNADFRSGGLGPAVQQIHAHQLSFHNSYGVSTEAVVEIFTSGEDDCGLRYEMHMETSPLSYAFRFRVGLGGTDHRIQNFEYIDHNCQAADAMLLADADVTSVKLYNTKIVANPDNGAELCAPAAKFTTYGHIGGKSMDLANLTHFGTVAVRDFTTSTFGKGAYDIIGGDTVIRKGSSRIQGDTPGTYTGAELNALQAVYFEGGNIYFNGTAEKSGDGFVALISDLTDRIGVFPEEYGAAGDGVTDDTAAIVAAAAAANTLGLPLVFGPKTYLTAPINITTNINVFGTPSDTTLLIKPGVYSAFAKMFRYAGAGLVRGIKLLMDDNDFDGVYGFDMVSSSGARFRDLEVYGRFYHGLIVDKASNFDIDGVKITSTNAASYSFVQITGAGGTCADGRLSRIHMTGSTSAGHIAINYCARVSVLDPIWFGNTTTFLTRIANSTDCHAVERVSLSMGLPPAGQVTSSTRCTVTSPNLSESVDYPVMVDGYGAGDAFHRAAKAVIVRDGAAADEHPRVALQLTNFSAGSGRGSYSPYNSRVGLSILNEQTGSLANVAGGQMDGVQVVHRVGGDSAAGKGVDGGAFLASMAFGYGYAVTLESAIMRHDPVTSAITHQVDINVGSVNYPDATGAGAIGGGGFQAIARHGQLTTGLGIGSLDGGSWQAFIQCTKPDNSNALNVDPSGNVFAGGGIRPKDYTVATVPSAAALGSGAMIHVSNESGGATNAYSDGTSWRRFADRAVIS